MIMGPYSNPEPFCFGTFRCPSGTKSRAKVGKYKSGDIQLLGLRSHGVPSTVVVLVPVRIFQRSQVSIEVTLYGGYAGYAYIKI